jgi:hypothetical protein
VVYLGLNHNTLRSETTNSEYSDTLLDMEDARLHAESGQIAEARKNLESLLAEASRTGLLLYQLESRLTLAELEWKSGQRAARAHLNALEKDARESGFVLLANKAREARSR